MPSTSPASTGNMIASRILMKNEINVHAVNTSNMIKMIMELKTSQGSMSPLLSMMVLQVTKRDRIMLVADNTERTIKMMLWLSSTRSSEDQTALVTYKRVKIRQIKLKKRRNVHLYFQ